MDKLNLASREPVLATYKIGDIKVTKSDASKRYEEDYINSAGMRAVESMMGGPSAPYSDSVGEHYIYEKDGNRISLIQVFGLDWPWEIFCLEGDLFYDIETFESKEEAEKRCVELLNG